MAQSAGSLSKGFLRELSRIHARVGSGRQQVAESDLGILAAEFGKLRTAVTRRIGGKSWRNKLPKYDPLHLPFGLLSTIDLGHREVAHTRTLAWLLDPAGKHGFGSALLEGLLEHLFRVEGKPVVDRARVECEVCYSRRDRVDIEIEWQGTVGGAARRGFLVIEAKIDAPEGKEQCLRYEKRHDNLGPQARLVFLTVDGRAPVSAKDAPASRWERLSFIELMAIMRGRMPALLQFAGFPFLRLYMAGVLMDLYEVNCGDLGEFADIYRVEAYLSKTKRVNT